ncbi:MAG: SRPBCC family protein [Chloroflexi bacterium]|nr:SRPBCC family protein [Chloroflexota bacterium]
MATLTSSITIDKPVEAVWNYFTDLANNMKWRSDLKEIKQTSPGAVGVGTKFSEVSEFMGQKMETPQEITAFDVNKKFGVKSAGGPIPFSGDFTFEPSEGGTKLSVQFEFSPGGIFKLAEGMVVAQAQKQFEGDFARLKQLLEAM